MVDDALQPDSTGTVQRLGSGDGGNKADRMCDDIERHGEAHATFEDVDGEVECRLGTTRINFIDGFVEVFDGDQYRPFAIDALVSWEVPMDVFHE